MGVGPLQQRTMPEGIADVLRRRCTCHRSSGSVAPLFVRPCDSSRRKGWSTRQAFKGCAVAIVSA